MGTHTKIRGMLNAFRESTLPDDATISQLRASLPEKFKIADDKQIVEAWGKALGQRTFIRSIRSAITAASDLLPEQSPPKPPALSETEIREFISLAGEIRHATMRMVELFQKARG